MLLVFSPSVLKNSDQRHMMKIGAFFQLPSVVEEQVDIRFSFFIVTQTIAVLKILYILVNDELYLQC